MVSKVQAKSSTYTSTNYHSYTLSSQYYNIDPAYYMTLYEIGYFSGITINITYQPYHVNLLKISNWSNSRTSAYVYQTSRNGSTALSGTINNKVLYYVDGGRSDVTSNGLTTNFQKYEDNKYTKLTLHILSKTRETKTSYRW